MDKTKIDKYHVAFYDMTRGGSCFDESFIKPGELEKVMWYVETDEAENCEDRCRVFVEITDGDVYELKLEKLTKEQIENRSTFRLGVQISH